MPSERPDFAALDVRERLERLRLRRERLRYRGAYGPYEDDEDEEEDESAVEDDFDEP